MHQHLAAHGHPAIRSSEQQRPAQETLLPEIWRRTCAETSALSKAYAGRLTVTARSCTCTCRRMAYHNYRMHVPRRLELAMAPLASLTSASLASFSVSDGLCHSHQTPTPRARDQGPVAGSWVLLEPAAS